MAAEALDIVHFHLCRDDVYDTTDRQASFMEAVAMFAGEPISAQPRCVSQVLTSIGRDLNSKADDRRRQDLLQFICDPTHLDRTGPFVTAAADNERDDARWAIAAEHSVRVAAPRWLDRAGLTEQAAALRTLGSVGDENTRLATDAPAYEAAYSSVVDKQGQCMDLLAAALADALATRTTSLARDVAVSAVIKVAQWELFLISCDAFALVDAFDSLVAGAAAMAIVCEATIDAVASAASDAIATAVDVQSAEKAVREVVVPIYENQFARYDSDQSWTEALAVYERMITAD
jgi:hypothetical protein